MRLIPPICVYIYLRQERERERERERGRGRARGRYFLSSSGIACNIYNNVGSLITASSSPPPPPSFIIHHSSFIIHHQPSTINRHYYYSVYHRPPPPTTHTHLRHLHSLTHTPPILNLSPLLCRWVPLPIHPHPPSLSLAIISRRGRLPSLFSPHASPQPARGAVC